MSDDPAPPVRHIHHSPPSRPVLFATEGSPPPDGDGGGRERNWIPWVTALIVILVIVAIIVFIGTGSRSGSQSSASGVAPYASHLAIRNVHISRASNFAGDQLTYVDGTIANRGGHTVTGVTVQVLFASMDATAEPQAEQVPLQLIRTRQPYIDIEPVSAEPLAPGTSHDFRLIFDDISPLWNQQIPTIQIQNVTIRH